ncbi:Wzz/FepE/Etk N-terminal domain-containing protein [Acuticoccus sp. M5D2P5]|uniref:GumC family protein n=1 Tax=Acuticoccus kalidii TaxID=2910977 RepID=UPI001F16A67E|nr:Wzz/FepE/Etk N-terminal domain-containing protein [Acuticoccus kalidii]MCF3931920.1 Wzz/FepE/Etk N-terminal domain-containing protein [Acuticoccus kalidii]
MNTIPDDFRAEPYGRSAAPARREDDHGEFIDLGVLFRAARRQAWLVIASIGVCSVLALGYAMSLQPLYTSYATILLDEDRAELVNLISELPNAALRDATVQSEVEVLKSQALAERVVDRLDLTARPDVLSIKPSPINAAIGQVKSVVSGLVALVEPQPEIDPAAEANPAAASPSERTLLAGSLRQKLDVQRIGRSYVLQISYTAPAPELAAEIAEAYTDAYLAFQLEANASAADSAVEWMRDRVETLRQASLDASQALATFRQDHGLVSVGERLLSEQQVSEVLSQLVLAQADATRARALADQAESAIEAGPDAALAALAGMSTANDTATETLRIRYRDALHQQRRVEARFGADHPEAQRLAAEVADAETQIEDELRRRARQARGTADAQQTRVEALRSGLDDAMNNTGHDGGTLYRLNQLEQTEQSYKQLYQSALTRLETVVPQQSIPITPARVITAPDMPKGASSPSKAKYLALGFLLGAFLGGGVGTLREFARDRIDNEADVRRILGLPVIDSAPRGRHTSARDRVASAAPRDPRVLRTLRAIKLALDHVGRGRGARSVAFLSAQPKEGAGPLGFAFAQMLASYGLHVLFIDAAERGQSVIEQMGAGKNTSLVDLARSNNSMTVDAFRVAKDSTLFAIPFTSSETPFAGTIFSQSSALRETLAALAEDVDYVIFNAPPATTGPDVDAVAPYVEAAVLVTRKGRTSAHEALSLVESPLWGDRIIGAVLT